MWTICWPIWTRRWLRSKFLPQRTKRKTEKSKDIRNFHRGDAEARREPRNLLLMNTDLKSQRKSQFSPRRHGDTEKSKKRFLPRIHADREQIGITTRKSWRILLVLARIFGDPVEIFAAACRHFQHHALREIIGMQFLHGIANAFERFGLGFDQEQPFRGGLYFLLPAIHRFDLRNDVDAGSQPALHQRVGDLSGFFLRAGGGHNDTGIAHREISKLSVSIRRSV